MLFFLLNIFAVQQSAIAQYNFFKLVAQWPPAACLTFSCSASRKPQNFTLHGIWPSNTTGNEPRDCFKTNHLPRIHFTGAMVQSLFPRINNSWPDLKGKEETFWGTQWDNHGTCSQNNFNVLNYFKLALDTKDRVDVLKAFVNNNIHPHPTNLYRKVNFENAIIAVTKKKPELRCILRDRPKVVYLLEVGLCLDSTGNNFMDCSPRSPVNVRVKNCDYMGQDIRLLPL
ncbi:ribonuclease 1-like [Trifolium medium]|uniref:Ribonuclease 1-like n=1 Tax=Trifolium medium TaxID=97028 RepID=A0A392LWX2_9FABA|nr:ribonuclease 1-like [Trifolium medium]